MIPGIVAGQDISGGGPSPPGNLAASLDFVNSVYMVNGASVAASSFLSSTDRISGHGLRIRATSLYGGSTGAVLLQGDVYSLVRATSWTIVIFQNTTVASGGGSRNYLLNLWKSSRGDADCLLCYTGGGGGVVFEYDGTTTRTAASNDWMNNAGENHVVFTRTNTHAAVANDGLDDSLVTDDGTAITQSYSIIDIGDAWDTTVDGFILKMDIYTPPIQDSQIVALTLPTPA